MKPSIKTITLKRLTAVAGVIVIALIVLISYNFRELTYSAMLDKGQTVAKLVESGLTLHMDALEKKQQFKERLQDIPNVKDLQIIRSEEVNDLFGLPYQDKLLHDPIVADVFSTKKQHIEFTKTAPSGREMIRTTIPFISTKERHCAECHLVPEGTVLGAVDFYIDISQYKEQSTNNLFMIFFLLSIILLGILIMIFRIIDLHIKNPLDTLIRLTRNSYETHSSIDLGHFQSKELEDVASKINLFNQEVIEKNIELENKNRQLREWNENLEEKVAERTKDLNESRAALEQLLEHTRSSIEYASLIQSSLIPSHALLEKYFSDHMVVWEPKDIVGGDIYLIEEFIDEEACLLTLADCTGHGVPGAFVTMLVKAIEHQVTTGASNSVEEVSPALMLSTYNKNIKLLLKQESEEAISNAGFDGAILYFNKRENIIRFAGASLSLYYVEDGEVKILKGDHESVGHKRSDPDFVFEDHTLSVKPGMRFYLTTDGFTDQNGGEKEFPFGKKRFVEIIEKYHDEPFAKQKEQFLEALRTYQGDLEQNDDITLIGFAV